MNKLSRIVLADDHELFLSGLANVIRKEADLEIVGTANDGFEAFQITRKLKPDLVIMDIRMPISDGIEATVLIRTHFPEIKVLILTVEEDDDSLFGAIKAGANGYMLKNASSADFVRNIRLVLNGDAVIPPRLAVNLMQEYSRLAAKTEDDNIDPQQYDLTDREIEILNLIATGRSNDEIAEDLVISVNTVKTHIRNILKKLHAPNRQVATQIAKSQGLLVDPPATKDKTG